MDLICPVCESKFSFDQACRDQLMRDFVNLAAFYGPAWSLVNEYADCFRTKTSRLLTMKKRKRVLEELKPLFEKNEFAFDGKRYRVTRQSLLEALKIVVNNEKHGFQNHNYLKTVLINNQAERLSAEGLTAIEEQKREEKRREGRSIMGRRDARPCVSTLCTPAQPMTAAEYKKRKGIQSLADRIGKNVP